MRTTSPAAKARAGQHRATRPLRLGTRRPARAPSWSSRTCTTRFRRGSSRYVSSVPHRNGATADPALSPAPLYAGAFLLTMRVPLFKADLLSRRLGPLQLGQKSKYGCAIVLPSPLSLGLQVALGPGTTTDCPLEVASLSLTRPFFAFHLPRRSRASLRLPPVPIASSSTARDARRASPG